MGNKTPFLVMTNSDMINFSQNKKNRNCVNMRNSHGFGIAHKKRSQKLKLCHGNTPRASIPGRNFCVEWIKKFKRFKKKCSAQVLEQTMKKFEESASKPMDPSQMIKNISSKIKGKKVCKKKGNEKTSRIKIR